MTEVAARRRTPRPLVVWALAAGALAFAWAWVLGRDLFVLAEARGFSFNRPPIDPVRFLLLPELGWGNGRLLGLLLYQGTGSVCGVDAGCFNAIGALLAGAGAVAGVLVGGRLTRSHWVALGAVAAWLASPTFIGMALWQGTWFDLLVMPLVLIAIGAWWEALGRERIGPGGSALFVVGSILLLALAFNAKETAYAALVVLPVIAIVRGTGRPGAIRRNLLLSALPLAYGAWFVAWGVTHIDAAYAAKELHEGLLGGLEGMLTAWLAQGDEFMYVPQAVTDGERLRMIAGVLAMVASVLVALLVGAAAWRAVRAGDPGHAGTQGAAGLHHGARAGLPHDALRAVGEARRGFVESWAGELVLLSLLAATTLLLSPTRAPTAYYLSLPVWATAALVLSLVRRAALTVPRGRVLAAAALGAWIAAQAITLAGVLLPGSTWSQLVQASGRMREAGAQLRTLLDGRAGGPVIWRTVGVPATDFFLLRDPGQGPRDATEADPAGGDLLPFLLDDPTARRRFTSLQGVTPEELLSGAVAETGGERTTTVVMDADYRLRLVLYEGQLLYRAPEITE